MSTKQKSELGTKAESFGITSESLQIFRNWIATLDLEKKAEILEMRKRSEKEKTESSINQFFYHCQLYGFSDLEFIENFTNFMISQIKN